MTPITEPEDAGVALMANLGKKVSWGEEETTEHPSRPLLEKRSLRVIDPPVDDGVWVILDTACNSTCHGRPWREDMERKVSETYELAFFWSSRKCKPIEGIGGKKGGDNRWKNEHSSVHQGGSCDWQFFLPSGTPGLHLHG